MKYIQYALAEKINKQQKVHDAVTWEIIIIFFFLYHWNSFVHQEFSSGGHFVQWKVTI